MLVGSWWFIGSAYRSTALVGPEPTTVIDYFDGSVLLLAVASQRFVSKWQVLYALLLY